MASSFYGVHYKSYYDSTITKVSYDSDTIKVALVTSSYTPNFDTHDFYDDITNEVANGNGYTTGGATLASKTLTLDTTNNRYVLDAADATWTNASITARGAVIYKSTGVSSTSPLIAYVDFTTDRIADGGTFQITWHANGIAYLSY